MPTITIHSSYSIEVPDYGAHLDIDRLKDIVTRSGSHFFDAATMRWFRSRTDYHTWAGSDGWYFVTSEKHVAHLSTGTINEPRRYTVRCLRLTKYDGTPGIELYELGAFQEYPTLTRARTAAKRAAASGARVCPDCHLRLMRSWLRECERCLECQSRKAER